VSRYIGGAIGLGQARGKPQSLRDKARRRGLATRANCAVAGKPVAEELPIREQVPNTAHAHVPRSNTQTSQVVVVCPAQPAAPFRTR